MSIFNRICNKLFDNTSKCAISTSSLYNSESPAIFINRNPRNLERLRLGYKPDGYHVEKPGRNYWHNLNLTITGRYVTAYINHYEKGEVLRASTKEWALKKQLYKSRDTSAFINLGRVLADRCLKSGLTEISCNIQPRNANGKIAKFLDAVQKSGIKLEEPPQFKPWRPWDLDRPEKPWEIIE